MKKRVCIIGSGMSGLTAVKACLEEGFEEVVCYEKTRGIGGLWNFRPNEKNIGATVMKNTVVNTSKEMFAFSDFPPPEHFANFMHHSKVKEYLEMYAKNFGLLKYICFGVEVKKVSIMREGANPQWEVVLDTGKSECFDAVMVANGHHAEPRIPIIPGIENFKGKWLHSHEYRDSRAFDGKNVVCVGIGNSGVDVAVDLTGVAKQVVLSTRRGSWVTHRDWNLGRPYDVVLQNRFYHWLMKWLPWGFLNDILEHRVQQRMDHGTYGLKPAHRFFEQNPLVNDDSLVNKLLSGLITITGDIVEVKENSVLTKDGVEFPADVIIFSTGYKFDFPFFAQNWIEKNVVKPDGDVELYNFIFPPEIPNLAFIGLVQSNGSFGPTTEMQSRLAAGVFSGRIKLPSICEMYKNIATKRAQNKRRFYEAEKHKIQTNLIPYLDELSTMVGCRPNLAKLALKDPLFALRLFFGPNVSYIYRLEGFAAWNGAEKTIQEVSHRIRAPLQPGAKIESKGTPPNGCATLKRIGWFLMMLWLFSGTLVHFSGGALHLMVYLFLSTVAGVALTVVYFHYEDITYWF